MIAINGAGIALKNLGIIYTMSNVTITYIYVDIDIQKICSI